VTLIGNECEELSADYYSVKEFRKAATKESSLRMLCFSQENRASSALKLSITENSQNRIADNEVIFKRKVHKSDKGIKNLSRNIFAEKKLDCSTEENYQCESKEKSKENVMRSKLASSPLKQQYKNEPKKMENVINIGNIYDFNKNDFNISLYDTVTLEAMKEPLNPSNRPDYNNISDLRNNNKCFNNNYNYSYSYKQRYFRNNYFNYYQYYNNAAIYNYNYSCNNNSLNSRAKYNHNCTTNNYVNNKNNNSKSHKNFNAYNNQNQYTNISKSDLNLIKENEDPKEKCSTINSNYDEGESQKEVSNFAANETKTRKTWDISDKNTEDKQLFLKDIAQIQEKLELERKASSVEKNNKLLSKENKESDIETIITNIYEEDNMTSKIFNNNKYYKNSGKKESNYLNNKNQKNNNLNNYYYSHHNNYYPSYKNNTNNKNKNTEKNKDQKKNKNANKCANMENYVFDSMQDEINFDNQKQQESCFKDKKLKENDELDNEKVKKSICNIIENFNIHNSFNVNIDKETFNLKKIVFKDAKENEENSSFDFANTKKVVYFEYENDSSFNKSKAGNKIVIEEFNIEGNFNFIIF